MKVEVQKLFEKDIAKIRDKKLAIRLLNIIKELEDCSSLADVPNVKKIVSKGNYYRVRLGEYRIGLLVKNDTLYLLRFLHRKDIYNYFP